MNDVNCNFFIGKSAIETPVPQLEGSKKETSTIITLPQGRNGAVTLRQKLRKDNIVISRYNVIKCVTRSDGALVVTLPNQEKKRLFVTDLGQLHYSIQREQYVPYKARIHTLPEGVRVEDVIMEVRRKFLEEPLGVELIPYRESNVRHRGLHFAVVSCNSSLYKKMTDTRDMNVWWQWCQIDATPPAIKCVKCGILGHTKRNCDKEQEVKAVQEDPTWKGCIDCFMQNSINGKRKDYRHWETDHMSNTTDCPTYRSLGKRQLRLWRKSEANTQEIKRMQNAPARPSHQNDDGVKDATMETT